MVQGHRVGIDHCGPLPVGDSQSAFTVTDGQDPQEQWASLMAGVHGTGAVTHSNRFNLDGSLDAILTGGLRADSSHLIAAPENVERALDLKVGSPRLRCPLMLAQEICGLFAIRAEEGGTSVDVNGWITLPFFGCHR